MFGCGCSLRQVIDAHGDEVWHLAFSHNGLMLASASRDCTAIIWRITPDQPRLERLLTLAGHDNAVALLAWSPDDSKILTCSEDTVRLWDATNGQMLHTYRCDQLELNRIALNCACSLQHSATG